MEDLSQFCCLNERCLAYKSRGAGNLSVCGYTDKARTIRLLYCCLCKIAILLLSRFCSYPKMYQRILYLLILCLLYLHMIVIR